MFFFFFLLKYSRLVFVFFFSSRRRHTRSDRDWSSDVCSSDLLNASRLAASARRDLLQVERRLNRARYLNAPDTAVLVEELRRDRARLEGVKQEGASRRAEAEARLQMIEAAASRGASWSETNYMLQRLDEGRTHVPLGLESARAEQQVREDTQRELRKELAP